MFFPKTTTFINKKFMTKSRQNQSPSLFLFHSICRCCHTSAPSSSPPPPRHLLNSEDWLSSGIGSEGTSGAQALLESRLRHAPHHLNVKTTSAARSALSGRGRPDRPRLGASVNIKTTLNFRCHMFWPALKLKRYRRNYPTCLWVKKQTMHQNGWWADDSKPLFYFWKVEEVLSKLGTITWIHFEKQEQTIRKTIVTIIYLSSYLFNYIIN